MSNDKGKDYWRECISEAAEECGAMLTSTQIDTIADAVQVSHGQYGMAFGVPPAWAHEQTEVQELQRQLEIERSKGWCPECRGKGVIYGDFNSVSTCGRCGGEGRCQR